MLITSKNHDVKQAVALEAETDDWIFALVSLQTCEGYGGLGNYGIARMNGGSSSRALVGLVPVGGATAGATGVRFGPRFTRDVRQLVARRAALLDTSQVRYCPTAGPALLWTLSWPQGVKLTLSQLDPYFIEVCRRVRLSRPGDRLSADIGTSSAARINAEAFKGAMSDPWAPVHVVERKALTLGDEGELDYKRIVALMYSDDWTPPMLASLGPGEDSDGTDWALIVQAFARGNSKTGGFKERVIALPGQATQRIGQRVTALHNLAARQINEIDKVSGIMRGAIALAVAGGDATKVLAKHRVRAQPAGQRLEAAADRLFFDSLWQRFDAEHSGRSAAGAAARHNFITQLMSIATSLLTETLAGCPCSAIQRPRAQVRAVRRFTSGLRHKNYGFPELFALVPLTPAAEEAAADAT
jgi:CRISPR system Cascade subunit CasA